MNEDKHSIYLYQTCACISCGRWSAFTSAPSLWSRCQNCSYAGLVFIGVEPDGGNIRSITRARYKRWMNNYNPPRKPPRGPA